MEMNRVVLRAAVEMETRPWLKNLAILILVVGLVGFIAVMLPDFSMAQSQPVPRGCEGESGGGTNRAFCTIAALALKVYGWLKIPAMSIAVFIGGFGLFKWLVQGASNPIAHKRGMEMVIGVIVLLFLLITLDSILNLVMDVGEDISNQLKSGVTPTK
jgi:hypothetical protein